VNNLVIPAAGLSSRFPGMKPKWLLTHPDGNLMIQKVLSSFNQANYDRVIITILRDHCEKYNADLILEQLFGTSVEVCILEQQTKDPAETIAKTIQNMDLTGFITIKDSDCYVLADYPTDKQFICGLTIDKMDDIVRIHNKSFIIKNDENIITDIIEKKVVSDTVCLGVYCLEIDNLMAAYNKINNSPVYRHDNEMYISHIVSYLISQSDILHFVEAKQFIDWGTLKEWRKEQRKFRTYFFDIDGVFLKNTGKYGVKNWSNSFEPIQENIDSLKRLSDSGAQIIFTTARSQKNLSKFKKLLADNNIKYKDIIADCYHSQRVIVNDFAPTNPYPSCDSISIPRNSNLGDYLE
jgi:CMP-2-keto-3-deoxyoctulosonic acid synthetase